MDRHTFSSRTVGAGSIAAAWDVGLHRSFTCAGRLVWVSLQPMREADGGPVWRIEWLPGPPLRLPPEDIEAFDRECASAKAAILRHAHALEAAA